MESGLPLDWLCHDAKPVIGAAEAVADLARATGADLIQVNMPTLAAGIPAKIPVVAVTHGCVSTWWQAAKRGEPLNPAYFWHRQLMGEEPGGGEGGDAGMQVNEPAQMASAPGTH